MAGATVAALGLAVPYLIPQREAATAAPVSVPSRTEVPALTPTQEPTKSPPAEQPAVHPSPQDSTDPRPTAPVTSQLKLTENARLRYFDVAVLKTEGNHEATAMAALVKVCYVAPHPGANADATSRTSTDPWSFGVYDGETQTVADVKYVPVKSFESSSEWAPAYEAKQLKVGECNEGWIAVHDGNPDLARAFVRYAPADFGDEITWGIDLRETDNP